MKTCSKCEEKKFLSEFNKNSRSSDNHGSYCRVCSNKEVKKWNDSKGPEYSVWKGMKSRCKNPNDSDYKHYGARGIDVSPRWDESYENFIKDMKKRPSERHSLDRMDNNKGYYKDNCRWTTHVKQTQNSRTRKDNTSGHRGVSWYEPGSKWRATISSNKKLHSLGYFDDIEDAVEARKTGESKYWNT